MADYDYIVVGAGSAGGALAARLSENPAQPGAAASRPGARSHPYSRLPRQLRPADRQSRRPTGATSPSPSPAPPTARSRCRAASCWAARAPINGLVWVRGQPLDYDTWAQMGAAAGAGRTWRRCSPASRATRRRRQPTAAAPAARCRSRTVPDQNPLYDALFKAAVAAGFKLNPDYNSEDQEGVVKTQASIYKGRRMSVAHCYLEPAMKRGPTCTSSPRRRRCRVLLEGKRCVGVDYEQGRQGRGAGRRARPSCGGRRRHARSSSSSPASASPSS